MRKGGIDLLGRQKGSVDEETMDKRRGDLMDG